VSNSDTEICDGSSRLLPPSFILELAGFLIVDSRHGLFDRLDYTPMVTSVTPINKQYMPPAQARAEYRSAYVTLEPDAYLDSTTLVTQLAKQTHASPNVAITNGTDSYHRNHQYSVTAITTSTGAIAERYAYTAYGQPTVLDASGATLQTSNFSLRTSYTGREWDATLSLHHFRARWMSPSAGRFLGRDPIGYFGALDLLGKFIENVEGNNHLRAWTYYSTGSFLRSSPREKLSLHSKGCLICVTNGNPLRFSDPTGLDRYWIGGMHPGDHSFLCVDEYDAAGNKSGYYCCEIGVRGHGGGCTGNGPGRGCIGRIDDCNY
jgi:RHS repeat-associated protein